MSQTKFRYNTDNLRYERVKISFFNALITIVSYLSFGVLFFAGLLILQNYIIETPSEKILRSENNALKQHKVVLAGQLALSNNQLEELKKQDLDLYEKLFETRQPKEANQSTSKREEILLAGTVDFNGVLNDLNSKFKDLYSSAKSSNQFYHTKASVKKEDLSTLFSIPSIVPVKNFDQSKLVSGFGTRINPFHKGHYHHDGVDIASARGTEVLASGHGLVVMTKRSDLLAGFGNYLEVDHGHGVVTRYSHLEEITVRAGQKIKKSQTLGTIGSSGGSIAPHLHYEVILNGENLDPVKFFAEGLNAGQFHELVNKSKKQNQSLD
jgi:murein DD-endopeptidase MepM/ murein hydrolase activator NlpD